MENTRGSVKLNNILINNNLEIINNDDFLDTINSKYKDTIILYSLNTLKKAELME